MKKLKGLLALFIMTASSSAFAIKEVGNGGDPLALDFKVSLYRAIDDLKNHPSTINMETLEEAARSSRVLIVDDVLSVVLDGSVQVSAAENFSAQNLIKVNRAGWNAISNPAVKEALALHEVLSLLGIESTGSYPISQNYLREKSGLSLSQHTLASVAVTTPCTAPKADADQLFKLLANPQSTSVDLKSFLQTHAVGIDALNQQCQTPMMYSLRVHREDLFRSLLALQPAIDVNAVQSRALAKVDQRTLFFFIVAFASSATIEEFRSKGADLGPFLRDHFEAGTNEFMIAAGSNSLSVVKSYLSRGADVNATTKQTKFTAFMLAAANNTPEVIDAMIAAGARVDYADTQGITALMRAASHSPYTDTLRTLVHAGANVNAIDSVGMMPIYYALGSDPSSATTIKTLVELGARIEGTTSGMATPLMQAAYFNRLPSVAALIEVGAHVNSADKDLMTPLAYATSSTVDSSDVIRELISAGANTESIDNKGMKPIFYIVQESNKEDVHRFKAMVEGGARVDVLDASGFSLLMYAAKASTLEAVDYLVNTAGADRDVLTKQNTSAWSIARYVGRPDSILKVLYTDRVKNTVIKPQPSAPKAPARRAPAPPPKKKTSSRRPTRRRQPSGDVIIIGPRPEPTDPDPVCRLQVCP